MPGLYGFIDLGPQERHAETVVTGMLAASPTAGEQVRAAFDVGSTSVRALSSPQTGAPLEHWDDCVALLDGYVLNRDVLVDRLARHEIEAGPSWSDARLLAAFCQREAEPALADVDGDFNLCIVQRTTGAATVLTSRHGSRHLYCAVTSEFVAFAPHLACLATVVDAAVDRLALQEMFNFGYIGGERSMLQGIRLLPGATVVQIAEGGSKTGCYWAPQYTNDIAGAATFDDLVDEAGAGFQSAVDLFLERFPRVAVPISGGLDSRAILAFASKRRQELPAYHCSWYAGEARIARQLTEAAGAIWHEYDPLTFDYAQILERGAQLTEGNIHCHQFWFQPLAQKMGGRTDVVLDGYLMDVFFGDTFLVLPTAPVVDDRARRDIINGLWRRCRPDFVRRAFLPGFYEEYEQANHDSLTEQMARVEEEDLSNFIHRFSFANRSNRYSVALPNAQRHDVEYGYPGLHRPLVDLYLRIPPRYKVGAAFSRAVLTRFAPEAARIPWAKTGRPLDRGKSWTDRLAERLPLRQAGSLALLRASGGRWDLSHRADLNRHFRQQAGFRRAHLAIADDERTYSRGIIDRRGLQRLTDMIDRGWPVFFLLQSLVTVELFHRRFID